MYRKVLATMLLLGALTGCTKELGTCGPNGECGAGGVCDVARNLCYTVVEAELDGGACTPACAPYEACTSRGCTPRYAALTVTPGDGGVVGAGPVAVQAELVLQPGVAATFPETLDFRVVRSDGGVGGTLTAGPRTAGVYPAQWTPPGDGVFLLTAAYPQSGGPSTTVHLTADTTPPTFTVTVPPADAGVADGGFTYADPVATTAWRRDQTVAVRIESDSPDLDPGNLSVLVRGHDGGTNLEGLSVAQATPCVGKSFCGSVDVPLWQPGLSAFRGNFAVEVTARDRVGNQVTRTGSIPVTRWKWSFNGGAGAIETTPAIGQLGTVYFGTSDSNGKVFALNPQGTKKWEALVGKVVGSPAVGTFSSGVELVYVGANSAGAGVLYALATDGGVLLRCPGVGSASGEITTSVALTNTQFSTESTAIETAIALGNGDALISLRPAATGSRQCRTDLLSASAQPGASIIVKGSDAYFGTLDTRVVGYQFSGTSGWGPKPGFNVPTIGTLITGLGFVGGNRIVGAGGLIAPQSGGVFSFLETDGSGLWKYPDPFTQSAPVRNMSVGSGNEIFFGREVSSGSADMTSINLLAAESRLTAANAGSLPGAPVLGAAGTLYTASFTGPVASIGEVSAWSTTGLTRLWRLSDTVGRTNASLTLDCARSPDGTSASAPHGVLYVPSLDGRLYSFVVDSRGLDTSAPWPKYQHDARNTGNPSTPISSCP